MRRIELSGEWTLRRAGSKKTLAARVPGCVQADLLEAREIPDPFLGMNLASAAEACASGWHYEKHFVAEEFACFDRVVLRFDGLDGAACVSLNDQELGRSANAFESHEYELGSLLLAGRNKLSVAFDPVAAGGPVRGVAAAAGAGGQPQAPTLGIWRGVSLLAFKGVRVTDVLIRQEHGTPGSVGLDVTVTAERFAPDQHLEVLVRVCYKGNILHEARDLLGAERTALRLNLKNPQFWWPAGLGEQPLYEVTVDVLAGRTCLEHVSRRIGLRQFGVEREADGGFRFSVNRHPFFLKGASWLPADLYGARLTRVEYARLVKAAAVANMNVLRVWGGGAYEGDSFYDLCDEYGLCVWQDFMLGAAQAAAPVAAEREAFAREARQQVRRLRHHPCLAVWGGGDRGPEGGPAAAYAEEAAAAVAACDPERVLLPAAPHVPFTLPSAVAAEPVPAFPEPRLAASYLAEDERNLSHPACGYHVTPASGTRRVVSGFADEFLMPSGFDNMLWLSQILQGVTLKDQYERFRMEDAAAGFVYWHLNHGWPGCSPSTLGYEGGWKAAHYVLRRCLAPAWLCGGYRREAGAVEVWAFNDTLKPVKGEVQWRLTLMDGTVAAEGSRKSALGAGAREQAAVVKVGEAVARHGEGNLVLWLYLLDEQGNQTAWNTVTFCRAQALKLQPPRMRAEIRSIDDNSYALTLTSHHPAMWVWISLEGVEARYDDNFFCLEPAKPFRVRVTPASRMKLDPFRQMVRIGSLRDTWQEKRGLMQMMAAAKR